MAIKPLLYSSLILLLPLFAGADTVQIIQGTAGEASPPTAASPSFPNVINFSNLSSQVTLNCIDNAGTACPTFNSSTYASQGVTISSRDGLLIYPFSTQTTGGIELFDEGPGGDFDGTANTTISLAGGVSDLAVGIADSDSPVDLTIEALGASGNVLDSFDASTAVENAALGTGNTYFAAEDLTGPGIYGLEILQTEITGGSGLALAEVEYTTETPEPSTLLFLIGGGLAIIGSARLRKKPEAKV